MQNQPNLPPDDVRGHVRRLIQQPYNVIEINPILFGPHLTHINREEWILANMELMHKIGPLAWMEGLLVALESPLTNEEFETLSEEDGKKALDQSNGIPSPFQHPPKE